MATNQTDKMEAPFITYDDIIKTVKPLVLKHILDNKDKYKDRFDLSPLEPGYIEQLHAMAQLCPRYNVLDILKRDESIDSNAIFNKIVEEYESIYTDSERLVMGVSISMLIKQPFIKNIFIYSEKHDDRIVKDIRDMYIDMERITYVSGPMIEAINALPIKPTAFFINKVYYVDQLIEAGLVKDKTILVPNYGYNYLVNPDNEAVLAVQNLKKKQEEHSFNLAVFNPRKIIPRNTKPKNEK